MPLQTQKVHQDSTGDGGGPPLLEKEEPDAGKKISRTGVGLSARVGIISANNEISFSIPIYISRPGHRNTHLVTGVGTLPST